MGNKLKVGVLASGGGTDLQSIIDASEKGMINAVVALVVSDNNDAYALQRAKKHNIKNIFVDPKGKNNDEFDKEIDKIFKKNKIELLVGAGYMRMLSPCFMDEKMDHGPIILQAAVKVMPDDDRDKLAHRILDVEHQILPRTVDLFAQGRLKIKDRKVIIKKGDSWLDKYKTYPNVLYGEGY